MESVALAGRREFWAHGDRETTLDRSKIYQTDCFSCMLEDNGRANLAAPIDQLSAG